MTANIREILLGVLLLVIIGGTILIHNRLVAYDQLQIVSAEQASQIKKLQENDARYDQALLDKTDRDNLARAVRGTITSNLTRTTHDDPVAANYLGAPIPDSVRAAFAKATTPAPASTARANAH